MEPNDPKLAVPMDVWASRSIETFELKSADTTRLWESTVVCLRTPPSAKKNIKGTVAWSTHGNVCLQSWRARPTSWTVLSKDHVYCSSIFFALQFGHIVHVVPAGL